ncbi:NAD dependent epimerase/dehydratase family protein-like protein [Clohesyomyces aquaticus]|uniref:NAD dependent epimerase/dehydratase family protein-like protein n=1 Tax=Clohesyomyces aquaticus TaxID=1231657 RepID=A0A1Y1Z0A6_9PLEO|nr:NAD dependent epimerase/dehydratase family protein-like protein [Clohesyomyces aquaticus]
MTTAALAGSTGLVGGLMLTELLANPAVASVYAYARRDIKNPTASTKLFPLTSTDSSTWPAMFPHSPAPKIFFSGLGTTRAAAGGLEAQRKIDVDLNYDLAKAAKEAGCETYVLISSASSSSTSMFPYTKMKGELEDKIKSLGFKHTVLMRPGLLVGAREESRAAEAVLKGVANFAGKLSPGLKNFWAQDSDVVARAAVVAGLQCMEGKKEEGVWVVSQSEIVRLGKATK